MSVNSTAWLQIHVCVMLWGCTAVLGRLISIPALPLVMWRMLLVAITLLLLPRVWRGLQLMSRRHFFAYCGVGVLVALHWLTFYAAVNLANASVAATCMALIPVFLCVIEPIVTGRRFVPRELLFGVLVLPGIALVVGGTPGEMNIGIAVGVLSALFVAIFTAYNKRLIDRSDALSITALEMASGGLLTVCISGLVLLFSSEETATALFPAASQAFAVPSKTDMQYLLILAFACTSLPFALALRALRHLSGFASALAVNLEPVYAIILAILILGEQQELNVTFYLGASLILCVVFIYPLQKQSSEQR